MKNKKKIPKSAIASYVKKKASHGQTGKNPKPRLTAFVEKKMKK